MHAGPFRNDLTHFSTHLANETRGARLRLVTRVIREDSTQIAIVNSGPLEIVTFTFAAIVFAQSYLNAESGSTFVRVRFLGFVPAISFISSSIYSSFRAPANLCNVGAIAIAA